MDPGTGTDNGKGRIQQRHLPDPAFSYSFPQLLKSFSRETKPVKAACFINNLTLMFKANSYLICYSHF